MKNEIRGLSTGEAESRKRHGLVNVPAESGSKTVRQIVSANVFTFFNLIFIVLAGFLFTAGRFTDMTFLVVAAANTMIGIIQEIRSKRAVDSLLILAAQMLPVLRDGEWCSLESQELVRDDIVRIEEGRQIPADAVIVQGTVRVNESLVSGEEDDVKRTVGDELHSGSICTSGRCLVRLTAVGAESYAAQLTREATTDVRTAKSDMMCALDRMIRMIGFILIPIGLLLFFNEFVLLHRSYVVSIRSMVAGLIGMIPEGLYLLTSVALAASVLRLSRRRVLVRDLNCVEKLARIDVLCVDKTGTITEPGMHVDRLVMLNGNMPESEMRHALSAFARSFETRNETALAIASSFHEDPGWKTERTVPFSSEQKYSAACFAEFGTIVVGAPQFVMGSRYGEIEHAVRPFTEEGRRVLAVVRFHGNPGGERLDEALAEPLALLVLSNRIRKNAAQTFAYFQKQGVAVKVISGDDAETASRIASFVSIPGSRSFVDASRLRTDSEIAEAAEKYTVFGRTTPEQKKKLIMALQARGHYVAMTGDGVNDVLALKEADCGIAMASGTEAASQIAQLVLLDSDFSSVPSIVTEGRRVINNIERSARLFLAKNVFSLCLCVLCVLLRLSYPLIPLQLSVISALTIGIPGFFLAMQPNDGIVKGSFLPNVLSYAIPGGLTGFLLIGVLIIYGWQAALPSAETGTMAVMIAFLNGLIILYRTCRPLDRFRTLIFLMMAAGSTACVLFLSGILGISVWSVWNHPFLLGAAVLDLPLILLFQKMVDAVMKRMRTGKKTNRTQRR